MSVVSAADSGRSGSLDVVAQWRIQKPLSLWNAARIDTTWQVVADFRENLRMLGADTSVLRRSFIRSEAAQYFLSWSLRKQKASLRNIKRA